ncbi:MAG: bifunctional (p)ppGpp synthetase/guanosine-3',5'-bis(diphosphate) 3'-pyrophosphohydrolase [Clostridiales bacterium]|nr:bifunctional (p)ppGpp synthetase/guanosine-3',5'-bis(diphosphate) 3'-pyrophosphohydrolase [Candidatus Apopatousia equi]
MSVFETSEKVQKALKFASEKHKGQKRDDGSDYIVHPIRVAKLVEQYKKSSHMEDLLCAALLHDTLEDTYTSPREIADNFGKLVASMVIELTTAPTVPKLIGKDVYLANKMINMTSYALVIKLADRLDNVRDLGGVTPQKRERYIKETRSILSMIKIRQVLTQAQLDLIAEINKTLKKYDEETDKEVKSL